MTSYLLLIWLAGIVDRIRGDDYDLFLNRISDKITYGWIISALFEHSFDYFTIYIIISFTVGISIGWGPAIGSALRGNKPSDELKKPIWWMKGIILKNSLLALAVRGAISGILFIPAAIFDYKLFFAIPIYIISFIIPVYFAKLLMKVFKKDVAWAWTQQEYFRGWLSAGLIAIVTTYTV